MLPNFIVIGAMKAGTTALHRYLTANPQVFMPAQKELRFFAEALNWSRGIDWYREQFAEAIDAAARGEASPAYSAYPVHPEVPERMAAVVPDAKLIYLVRHPIERMESQWLYLMQRGHKVIPKDIDAAFKEYPPLLDRSRYATQLERHLDHFPRHQILVVISEALREEREQTMNTVFRFLGVEADIPAGTLERKFHVTSEERGRRRWAKAIRRVPGYSQIAQRVPGSLRALNYRLTTRSVDPALAQPSNETRLEAEERLQPEVTRLRAFIDDPNFDGWGIG